MIFFFSSVEYAQKAVDNSGTMIALRGKNGVVTAVDKVITSKMYEEVSTQLACLEFLNQSYAAVLS